MIAILSHCRKPKYCNSLLITSAPGFTDISCCIRKTSMGLTPRFICLKSFCPERKKEERKRRKKRERKKRTSRKWDKCHFEVISLTTISQKFSFRCFSFPWIRQNINRNIEAKWKIQQGNTTNTTECLMRNLWPIFLPRFLILSSPICHYPARSAWPSVVKASISYTVVYWKPKSCISLARHRMEDGILQRKNIITEWPFSSSSRITIGHVVGVARSYIHATSSLHSNSRIPHIKGNACLGRAYWICALVLPWRFVIESMLWTTWLGLEDINQ